MVGLSASERLLALEIADEHHEELHRQTAHRLEMGDRRMDHIEGRIGTTHQEVRDLTQREQAREMAQQVKAEEKAAFRESRKQAIQMAVWAMALLTGMITLWNFAAPRVQPHASAITAPAPR